MSVQHDVIGPHASCYCTQPALEVNHPSQNMSHLTRISVLSSLWAEKFMKMAFIFQKGKDQEG